MTKMNFALVSLFLGMGITSAQAANKSFHVIDGVDRGCKVAKFAGGKWVQSPEQDLNGQEVTNVTPSKANAEFSNFKYSGNWYAAKNDCLKDSEGGSSDNTASSTPGNMPKYFAELKLQKFLVMGTNTGAATTTATGTTQASEAYKSGVGFAGRFGYHWKENKYWLLDISDFTASQDSVFTGAVAGSPKTSDSLLTVNVGVQWMLEKPLFGLKPYVAGSLGYAKFSGTLTGAVTTTGGAGNLGIGYSASGFDLKGEAGLAKEFNPHWSGLLSLGFTYTSLSPKVDTSNLVQLYPVGSDMPKRGYSHLTLALGARYSF